MNILITTGIFPPDIGGPATYVPTIAQHLIQCGHRVSVITLCDRENILRANTTPFRVHRIVRQIPIPVRMLRTIYSIVRLGIHCDVLFANGLFEETVFANYLLRKPLIMKIVGDAAWERAMRKGWTADNFEEFQVKPQSWRAELLKKIRSWYVKRVDRVIVPSRYLARWIQQWGIPKERITVIYNALESVDGIMPLPIPLSTPIKAVTVSRLVPWKRVDGILEAIAKIPDLGLVVIGDGPERPRLEQRAVSLGISERVYFAGRQSRKETLGLMATCDLFVLNSTYEGLPHVILEAMALGLPVVATAVGGIPEVVKDGETGVLVDIKNSVLESELLKLIKDVEIRVRLGREAKRWVLGNFSLNTMLTNTEQVLLQVGSLSR